MADNITLNVGSGGSVVATDDDGTAHHQYVKVEFGADNTQTPVDSSNPLPVIAGANSGVDIGDVDVTSVIPGTAATNLGKAIDSVAGATDTGVAPLAIRDDSTSALTPAEGDYAPLRVNANGALHVNVDSFTSTQVDDAVFTPATDTVAMIGCEFDDTTPDSVDEGDGGAVRMSSRREMYVQLRDAAGNERGLNVDGSGQIAVTLASLPASTNTLEVVGDVAHDAAAAGNPVAIAARATNTIETLTQVAAADATFVTADLNGCLVTRNGTTLEELISERVSDTAGTSSAFSTFAAGGAGIHNYITSVTIHNAHASTNGYVDIRDGTAGSVMWTFPAPATGGATHNFNPPLKQATANTALAYDVSAAITTIYISVNGFQAQG